jgi:hypothetical protein
LSALKNPWSLRNGIAREIRPPLSESSAPAYGGKKRLRLRLDNKTAGQGQSPKAAGQELIKPL